MDISMARARKRAHTMGKHLALIFAFGVMALALAACAHQPDPGQSSPPGFFSALFHGVTAPFTLFLGWLWDGRIYAFPNSGWFYDLGFLLGLSVWGGGGAAAARNSR